MNKSNIYKLIVVAVVAAGTFSGVSTTASAKTHKDVKAAKLIKEIKTKHYYEFRGKHGIVYSNYKLKKVVGDLKKHKHTKFKSNTKFVLKLANGKKATYRLIKHKHFKGVVLNRDVKVVKVHKHHHAKAHSKSNATKHSNAATSKASSSIVAATSNSASSASSAGSSSASSTSSSSTSYTTATTGTTGTTSTTSSAVSSATTLSSTSSSSSSSASSSASTSSSANSSSASSSSKSSSATSSASSSASTSSSANSSSASSSSKSSSATSSTSSSTSNSSSANGSSASSSSKTSASTTPSSSTSSNASSTESSASSSTPSSVVSSNASSADDSSASSTTPSSSANSNASSSDNNSASSSASDSTSNSDSSNSTSSSTSNSDTSSSSTSSDSSSADSASFYTPAELAQVKQYQSEAQAIGNGSSDSDIYAVKPSVDGTSTFNVGKLNSSYIQNTMDWINFFRQMGGLSPLTNNADWNEDAQYGAADTDAYNALYYLPNNKYSINHGFYVHGIKKPSYISDADWKRGDEATTNSNLSYNTDAPYDVIAGYLNDGSNLNTSGGPGHREWLLGNITQVGVGKSGEFGAIKVSSGNDYNSNNVNQSPVVFPYASLFPVELAKNTEWSISVPTASSSAITPTVTVHDNTDNQDVAVQGVNSETQTNSNLTTNDGIVIGYNTSYASGYFGTNIWFTPDANAIKVNHSYTITVSGVPGMSSPYSYTTKLFDLGVQSYFY